MPIRRSDFTVPPCCFFAEVLVAGCGKKAYSTGQILESKRAFSAIQT
jgi:hypothetical protein